MCGSSNPFLWQGIVQIYLAMCIYNQLKMCIPNSLSQFVYDRVTHVIEIESNPTSTQCTHSTVGHTHLKVENAKANRSVHMKTHKISFL